VPQSGELPGVQDGAATPRLQRIEAPQVPPLHTDGQGHHRVTGGEIVLTERRHELRQPRKQLLAAHVIGCEHHEPELGQVEKLIRELATVVEPDIHLSVLEDEPDNRILECAVEAGASAIVTGDKDLIALKSYEGIGVMTVAELLYTFPALPEK
jgi:predicted nucleic acid-binding protein